ncbi:hydroxyethylthiazole kinase [Lactobacillaceae bacterium L1_55_11]|nr:hydroxyethylthiazole kinase [Lactobacillaceae bacterium L1_55_11]
MLTIENIRQHNPVILNVANFVTPQRVADAINFYGGSPIMFTDADEAQDLMAIAKALVINLGTTNAGDLAAGAKAGQVANQKGLTVVIDPVAVSATKLRQENFKVLTNQVRPTLIRGNAGEIAYLAGENWQANGIDAGQGSGDLTTLAEAAAKKQDCLVVLSGPSDFISDGETTWRVDNGHPAFQTNVGSGDMLDGLLGVVLALSHDLTDIARTVATFSIAGELAGHTFSQQPASFMVEVFNQLANLTDEVIDQHLKMTAL